MVDLGHFDKHFVKNTRKKTPRERFWSFFCRYSWNYILNGKFNSRLWREHLINTNIWLSVTKLQCDFGLCLNNAEYDWIYQHISEKNQSAEYTRTLNVFDAVHSIRSLYKVLSSYHRQRHTQNSRTFKMERFAKRMMSESKRATRNFLGQGRGWWI